MAGINRDLLYLNSENSRFKIKEMGRLLKKTPQRLKYTLKTLTESGILYNPHCIFDYSYFGQILFKVYFKGGYISENDKMEIIKKLAENEYIVAMYELNGEFDLAIEIESPNPSRFNKELRKVCNLIPSLNNFKMVLNLVTYIYPRAYLLKNNEFSIFTVPEIILGGDRPVEQFSVNEMKIMHCLLENPQLRYTHLAKLAGINIKTAISTLHNLRKRKIIKGFKYTLDTNKLGIYKFRLFLDLHNLSQERDATLMEYLLKIPEVVQVNKTIGDWNMEIDIESLEKTRIKHIISQLREDFKDLIAQFNLIEFYQYYERSFLPKYLFEQKEYALPEIIPVLPEAEEDKTSEGKTPSDNSSRSP